MMSPVPVDEINIAWGAMTRHGLTIWVGQYTDGPSPAIENARPVARWDVALGLRSMAASPDGHSLALLTEERCFPPDPLPTPDPRLPITDGDCFGPQSQYIYVVDLVNNSVRSIPDYYSDYKLYAQHSYPAYRSILGWFDNERFGVRGQGNEMNTATKDGLYFEYQPFYDLGPHNHPYHLSLLADRKTLFAWASPGFYLRDAPTGVIRKIADLKFGEGFASIAPSPDGSWAAFVTSDVEMEGNFKIISESYSLWVQDLATGERSLLANIEPRLGRKFIFYSLIWSPDSSEIAFIADDTLAYDDSHSPTGWSFGQPSNVYRVSLNDKQVSSVTSFTEVSNGELLWTHSGNLMLSSTFGSQPDSASIVSVSPPDKSTQVVRLAAPGELLVGVTLFDAKVPTGMPKLGADPCQP
jgi:hypothetical protein